MANERQQVLIIGLGNTLRGDDALGRIAAERLRQQVDPAEVRVIDQCAPTPELAAEMSSASLVIFLDASVDGPVDEVITRHLQPPANLDATSHQLGPSGLLALSGHLYGCTPETFAVTFRGQTFDFEDCRLSPAVEQACQSVIEQTLQLIETHRHEPRAKQPACTHHPNAADTNSAQRADVEANRNDRSSNDVSGG